MPGRIMSGVPVLVRLFRCKPLGVTFSPGMRLAHTDQLAAGAGRAE
jgi:hypothetical protein